MKPTTTTEMSSPTAAEKRDGNRNIYNILWHNLPLAMIYLAFGLWRSVQNGAQAACDVVCNYTNRFGDMLPVASAIRVKLAEIGAPIDVELAREIVFFNIVIGIWAIPITVFAYIHYVRGHGVHKDRKIRAKSPIRVLLATILLLALLMMSVVYLTPKDIVLTHWTGLFFYNWLSVCVSIVLMFFVLHVHEWNAGALEAKRQGGS